MSESCQDIVTSGNLIKRHCNHNCTNYHTKYISTWQQESRVLATFRYISQIHSWKVAKNELEHEVRQQVNRKRSGQMATFPLPRLYPQSKRSKRTGPTTQNQSIYQYRMFLTIFDYYLDVDTQAVYKCILSLPVFKSSIQDGNGLAAWLAPLGVSPRHLASYWSSSPTVLDILGYLVCHLQGRSRFGEKTCGQTCMGQKSNMMRPQCVHQPQCCKIHMFWKAFRKNETFGLNKLIIIKLNQLNDNKNIRKLKLLELPLKRALWEGKVINSKNACCFFLAAWVGCKSYVFTLGY